LFCNHEAWDQEYDKGEDEFPQLISILFRIPIEIFCQRKDDGDLSYFSGLKEEWPDFYPPGDLRMDTPVDEDSRKQDQRYSVEEIGEVLVKPKVEDSNKEGQGETDSYPDDLFPIEMGFGFAKGSAIKVEDADKGDDEHEGKELPIEVSE
jgi:hypothetical protein